MYEFDQLKEKMPRSPYGWAIPLVIIGILAFLGVVLVADNGILVIPGLSSDALIVMMLAVMIASELLAIFAIVAYSRNVAMLIASYVYPTIVDRANMEFRHQYSSIPHTHKTPVMTSLREIFSYSSGSVAWQLSTADFPRVDIQKIALVQSNGKSSSTVFDGFLILKPLQTKGNLILQPYAKVASMFKHRDSIALPDNTTLLARGEASLCTSAVQQFYHTIQSNPAIKKAYLSIHEGNLKVLVQMKKQKFTKLRKLNDTEYEAITNDLRSMLHTLDQLIDQLVEFPLP